MCQREKVHTCTCGGAVAVRAMTALGWINLMPFKILL